MADVVRIRNVGDKDFVGGYEQNRYVISPGQETVVPYHAAQHWTGRWNLIDKEHRKDRQAEVARLHVLYGIFDDETVKIPQKMEENLPHLEVYDLDGVRITTVLEDPDGKSANPVDTTALEKELIDDQIQSLQRELASLTAALAQRETNKEGTYEPSADDVPTDAPKKVPVSDGPRRGRTPAGS